MRALDRYFLVVTGVAAPLVFGVAVFVAGSLHPGYSHASRFISELGAIGAPYRAIVNHGGIIPAGVLTVAFAVAMYRTFRPGLSFTVASGLVAIAGLARLTAGIFPCDPGCFLVEMSTPAQIHALAGLAAFTTAGLAPFVFAIGTRSERPCLFALSLTLGAAALVSFGVGMQQGAESQYVGALQRFNLAFFYAWGVSVAIAGTTSHRASAR